MADGMALRVTYPQSKRAIVWCSIRLAHGFVNTLPTSNGVPYLPDGCSLSEPPRRPWPVWVGPVVFVVCYLALQWGYAQCSGTAIERFVLVNLGSQPAALLIDLLQPALQATSVGTRVLAPGGLGVNINNGCEGTDLYFLLLAAFAAVALPWKTRCLGLSLGLIVSFVLNQVRIIALFFAQRSDHALFDLLHTTMAPVLLVIALGLYFHTWLYVCRRPAHTSA